MVSAVILVGATLSILGVQVRGNAKDAEMVRICIESSGVDVEEISKMNGLDMSREKMCFLKCVGEQMGMISKDGKINVNDIDSMPLPGGIPEDKKNEFLDCISKAGKIEKCEDVAKFLACHEESLKN